MKIWTQNQNRIGSGWLSAFEFGFEIDRVRLKDVMRVHSPQFPPPPFQRAWSAIMGFDRNELFEPTDLFAWSHHGLVGDSVDTTFHRDLATVHDNQQNTEIRATEIQSEVVSRF